MANEKEIWSWLMANSLFTDEGIAGLMGNFQAESNCESVRVQGDFAVDRAKSKAYVAAVDSGELSVDNYARDGKAIGLAQWTYWSRKEKLYKFAKANGKSIGDLHTQLAFCVDELASDYPAVYKILCNTRDVKEASDAVLLKYERPADMSKAVQDLRAGYARGIFNTYRTAVIYDKPDVGQLTEAIIEEIRAAIKKVLSERLG